MSLQHVAHHLASKGRGEDTTLVHMTPREVGGLQALAKAHGGSLTINPHTGLAEAGFLRNLLPALAGAGLMMVPGMQALGAAAIVGGGTALATGDLKSGLMAGLGAYGGAGLANGAMTGAAAEGGAAGAGSGVPAAPDVGVATSTPVTQGSAQGVQLGSFNETGQAATGFQPTAPAPTFVPEPTASSGIDLGGPGSSPSNMTPYQQAGQSAQSGIDIGGPGSSPANMGQQAQGFERAGQNFMADPKLGIAAISPGLLPNGQPLPEEDPYSGPLSQYKFDPNKYRSADRSQPNPYYKARMYNYAAGGPIEQMSNANAVGQNTGYPMANVNKATYATPWQTPVSQNVVTGTSDTGVDSMTGEQTRFAAGGITGGGNLDLHIPLDLGGGGGNQGGSQSAYGGGQGNGGGMPGFAGSQPSAFGGGQGAFGGMQQPQAMQQNPFQGDDNWNNYQNQMNEMVSGFQNSDQYKNMDQLRQTMLNYQQQRMGAQQPVAMAAGGAAYAQGGISSLGSYSDGGRMLKGPGDGMSDNIPAQIGSKQPARLADGEFVVPADVVSHLGNGSTDAGARQLYGMMDRIRSQRTGKKKQAPRVDPKKAMPV